ATTSHQLALEAARWGGGQAAAKRLEAARLLACGIGLPIAPVEGDVHGLRLGVPEIVRLGMKPEHMGELGALIARALGERPDAAAADVEAFRRRFRELHYIN
ncbi:MAG: serine hydroxymethyltransferase, partial [Burkholderiaceae bacterium]